MVSCAGGGTYGELSLGGARAKSSVQAVAADRSDLGRAPAVTGSATMSCGWWEKSRVQKKTSGKKKLDFLGVKKNLEFKIK